MTSRVSAFNVNVFASPAVEGARQTLTARKNPTTGIVTLQMWMRMTGNGTAVQVTACRDAGTTMIALADSFALSMNVNEKI